MTDVGAPVRLRVKDLSKAFFGVPVLRGVSFVAESGRVLAMLGENGSGKSTALNVLTGVVERDGGEIWLDGEPFAPRSRRDSDAAGVAFIQQELNVFSNLTVRENLFLVRPPRRLCALPFLSVGEMLVRSRELLREVDLEVSENTMAGALSVGERQLLEIARGLKANARLFLLDEPTSSLSERECARLFEIIRRLKLRGTAIVFVSHNLEHVLELADDVLVVRDGQVVLQAPNADVSGADLITAMVGRRVKSIFPTHEIALVPRCPAALEVQRLTRTPTLHDVSFAVWRGEIVGLAGLLGSGRSELARSLFGLGTYEVGEVRVNGSILSSGDIRASIRAGVAFLTEDRRREGLLLNATVAQNMALAVLPRFASRGVINEKEIAKAVHELAQLLELKATGGLDAPIRTLSGGNQQKVLLGRWILSGPSVFILDEPTRGVDVGARQEIYCLMRQMASKGVALLVISSDLDELLGLCDRILVMRQGRICAQYRSPEFDRCAILQAAFGQQGAA